jgi:hypothetical protein
VITSKLAYCDSIATKYEINEITQSYSMDYAERFAMNRPEHIIKTPPEHTLLKHHQNTHS